MNQNIDNENLTSTQFESFNSIANFLNNIQGSVFVINFRGDFIHINTAAAQLLQRNQKTLLGKNILVEFPELNSNLFKYNFQRVIEKKLSSEFQYYYPPAVMLAKCSDVSYGGRITGIIQKNR